MFNHLWGYLKPTKKKKANNTTASHKSAADADLLAKTFAILDDDDLAHSQGFDKTSTGIIVEIESESLENLSDDLTSYDEHLTRSYWWERLIDRLIDKNQQKKMEEQRHKLCIAWSYNLRQVFNKNSEPDEQQQATVMTAVHGLNYHQPRLAISSPLHRRNLQRYHREQNMRREKQQELSPVTPADKSTRTESSSWWGQLLHTVKATFSSPSESAIEIYIQQFKGSLIDYYNIINEITSQQRLQEEEREGGNSNAIWDTLKQIEAAVEQEYEWYKQAIEDELDLLTKDENLGLSLSCTLARGELYGLNQSWKIYLYNCKKEIENYHPKQWTGFSTPRKRHSNLNQRWAEDKEELETFMNVARRQLISIADLNEYENEKQQWLDKLKKRQKKLALAYHPDTNPEAQQEVANAKFSEMFDTFKEYEAELKSLNYSEDEVANFNATLSKLKSQVNEIWQDSQELKSEVEKQINQYDQIKKDVEQIDVKLEQQQAEIAELKQMVLDLAHSNGSSAIIAQPINEVPQNLQPEEDISGIPVTAQSLTTQGLFSSSNFRIPKHQSLEEAEENVIGLPKGEVPQY